MDIPGLEGIDRNEEKSFSFEDFAYIMRMASIVGVIKFWALVLRSAEEVPLVDGKPVSVEELVYLGSGLVRMIFSGVDRAAVIAQIKQADIDSGQTTDLSFLDLPMAAASKGPSASGPVQ